DDRLALPADVPLPRQGRAGEEDQVGREAGHDLTRRAHVGQHRLGPAQPLERRAIGVGRHAQTKYCSYSHCVTGASSAASTPCSSVHEANSAASSACTFARWSTSWSPNSPRAKVDACQASTLAASVFGSRVKSPFSI